MELQTPAELDRHYDCADPWGYEANAADQRRKSELLGILPQRKWERVLDIGCGNGYITFDLPGSAVLGVDLSGAAVRWAEQRRLTLREAEASKFAFRQASILDLTSAIKGRFDLVVITGVLYPQYIGGAAAVARREIDQVLEPDGVVISCHIDEWHAPRLPYTLLDTSLYPYREYMHRLEVYVK